jgi:hypothetical protein
MKLPREVVIRIRPNGKVEIETFGFVGTSCAEIAEFLERILAGENPEQDDIQRDLKPEYYLEEQEEEIDVRDRGPRG